jgi:hypothetical protein
LDEVVEIDAAREPAAQPRAQQGFVRQNMVVEPTVIGGRESVGVEL